MKKSDLNDLETIQAVRYYPANKIVKNSHAIIRSLNEYKTNKHIDEVTVRYYPANKIVKNSHAIIRSLNEYKTNKHIDEVTHNQSQSVQPQIFKTKLSIWVYSIWFTGDNVEV